MQGNLDLPRETPTEDGRKNKSPMSVRTSSSLACAESPESESEVVALSGDHTDAKMIESPEPRYGSHLHCLPLLRLTDLFSLLSRLHG